MTVYEKLRKMRTDKHFSEKDVAEILGMRLDSYSRLEHGVGKIGSFVKNKLALLYDKDPDYFVDDPEPEPEPEPELELEPEPEPELELEPGFEPDMEAEPEFEPEPEQEPDSECEPEPEVEQSEPDVEEQTGDSADISPEDLPENDEEEPYKCVKVGEKKKIKVEKKIAEVKVSDESIAKVKVDGKKIKLKGKNPGVVTVIAYNKKDEELGRWIVKVE